MAKGTKRRLAPRAPRRGRSDPGTDRSARGRLLAAAATLFARRGYAGTSVESIVRAAAVTKPVLYYWFRSKAGLFLEIMEEARARFEAAIDAARGGPADSPGRLRALCGGVIDLVLANLETSRFMYALSYGPPQGAPDFDCDAMHERLRGAVVAEVERGMRRGELRRGSAPDAAWLVLAAMSVCIEIRLSHPGLVTDVRGLFDRLFDTSLRGIAAAGGRE
jgi:AcrR family transcriptional regulator